MGEVRDKIREITQKYFLDFIWKTESYKKVTLDKNYSMGIEHNLGYECLGTLSAAERALLALSFTIGLHKVSGFEAPLVIDTPIARVSDINRINLAKVIKNISEDKQIILLLTPDEYSVEVNKILDHISSTLIKLDAEDEKNITLSEVL
jgi:DNA sulfur modification protein DndD